MIFEKNSQYEGKHAILSASQCAWLKYSSEEEFFNRFKSYYAAQIGTILHDLAQQLIKKKIKINKHDKKLVYFRLVENKIPRKAIDIDSWYDAFSAFVNDAIDLGMSSEIQLIFSPVSFGTTDCICFEDGILRIHDLKTGSVPAKMDQLMVYAGFFCLQHKIRPIDIRVELRIYQNKEVVTLNPEPEELLDVIDKIKFGTKIVSSFMDEEE